MDICYGSDISILSGSQGSSPFPTGYDFDVNEITELEDLPSAIGVRKNFSKNYSIIVSIQEITSLRMVTTKYGSTIPLIKLVVADQTASGLEIACWDQMATNAQTMRIDDIVHFRGIISYEFANLRYWSH